MKKQKEIEEIKVIDIEEVAKEPIKNLQKFRLLKQLPTSKKIYKKGDSFEHDNKEVIDFLTTNKTIVKWD